MMDGPPQTQPPAKFKFACVRCAERKVKCDRQDPCHSCIKHNAQCIFRAPKPSRRRKVVKDALLDERLKRYEAVLVEKGIDPGQVTSDLPSPSALALCHSETKEDFGRIKLPDTGQEPTWQLPTLASTTLGSQFTAFEPKLHEGQKGRSFVDNSLWSRVAEEIDSGEEDGEEDSSADMSDANTPGDGFGYVLGLKSSTSVATHPPPEAIRQLWQAFVENIDPLIKIVHVPSLHVAIEKATADIKRIPKGFEAFMFALYSMAILSLQDSECTAILGHVKSVMLPHYILATKAALSRADFMSTTSVVVLQALHLHMLSMSSTCEPRAAWCLSGTALRIAEGIGMHLDGTLLGLSPFETEMYRRIWWQIRTHDFRAAELAGQAKFRDFIVGARTPKHPSNVNDNDLYPSMPQNPVEATRPTEMMWIMFRSDMANFAATQTETLQKEGKPWIMSEENAVMDDLAAKDDIIKAMEDMFETKYFRFCDPTKPLHLLTLVAGRMALNLIRFNAHHPRRWATLKEVPAFEQDLVWQTVVQIVEQYDIMQSTPQLQRFGWTVPYYIQWPAVIHILDSLRATPLHSDATKAWRLIDRLYEHNMEMMLSIERPIMMAVGNLCLKAYNARTSVWAAQGKDIPPPPSYITKLRSQREAAKARREATATRSKRSESLDNHMRATSLNPVSSPESSSVSQGGQLTYQTSGEWTNYGRSQPITPVEDDTSWFNTAIGISNTNHAFGAGAPDNMMNIDTDTFLAQGYWQDPPMNEVIDWTQWDMWFGEGKTAQSSFGG
ncbi:MAG: hypothetical protein Q9174_003045 [Haloplaca sp. 1 TL-2023]